jgi:hypothetical protein
MFLPAGAAGGLTGRRPPQGQDQGWAGVLLGLPVE